MARAVNVFYARTPSEASKASAFARFGPGRKSSDPSIEPVEVQLGFRYLCKALFATLHLSLFWSQVTVAMTKCLYAMLQTEESFAPPPRLTAAWTSRLAARGYRVPSMDMVTRGARLTAGFEMLLGGLQNEFKHCRNASPATGRIPNGNAMLTMEPSDLCQVVEQLFLTMNFSDLDLGASNREKHCWVTAMALQPVDSDDWMRVSPEELEAMLKGQAPPPLFPAASRETVYATDGTYDVDDVDEASTAAGAARLGEIVDGVHGFLGSSGEAAGGAELPAQSPGKTLAEDAPVSFDFDRFMELIKTGPPEAQPPTASFDDDLWGGDGNSESDCDDGDDEHEEAEVPWPRVASERVVDTLCDDEPAEDAADGQFRDDYDWQLAREIGSSEILAKSFERAASQPNSIETNAVAAATAAEKQREGGSTQDDEDMMPVDLDANLVKHLLESFASQVLHRTVGYPTVFLRTNSLPLWQEGMAGPASNLLREMGIYFPEARAKSDHCAGNLPAPKYEGKGDFMYELD